MKEAERVGLQALGAIHQNQRQCGANPNKRPKQAQSGSYGHGGNNNHLNQNYIKPQTFYGSNNHQNLPSNQHRHFQQFNPSGYNNQNQFQFQGRRQSRKPFQRTSSVGDAPQRHQPSSSRARCVSGGGGGGGGVVSAPGSDADSRPSPRNPSKSIPSSPVAFKTTPVKSGEYFAMAKFNESPEPSALPDPPKHWQVMTKTTATAAAAAELLKPPSVASLFVVPGPCNNEFRLAPTHDGIDFTAHLKTLLRVQM